VSPLHESEKPKVLGTDSPPASPRPKRPWGWFTILSILIVVAATANAYFWFGPENSPCKGF
jgi:hypothetical protein